MKAASIHISEKLAMAPRRPTQESAEDRDPEEESVPLEPPLFGLLPAAEEVHGEPHDEHDQPPIARGEPRSPDEQLRVPGERAIHALENRRYLRHHRHHHRRV